MSESELQNPDDNLKEILGFDPESGQRLESRSSLEAIESSALVIPEEGKDAFIKFANSERLYRHPLVRIFPERLLTVNGGKGIAVRTYFSWSANQGDYNFRRMTSAVIERTKDKLVRIDAFWPGEHNLPYVGYDPRFESDQLTIRFYRDYLCEYLFCHNERECWIDFDREDAFLQLSFGIGSVSDIIFYGETFQKLLKNQALEISNKSDRYKFNLDSGTIIMRRVRQGELRDELVVPLEASREKIIQKLFDPGLLANPVTAPPELDDSWRFANLMETVGVKWERY